MHEAIYWMWLSHALGAGAHQSEAILHHFDSAKDAYEADSYPDELMLTTTQRRHLMKKELSSVQAAFETIQSLGAWVLTPEDALYTTLFEGMYAPPLVLYVKGECPTLEDRPRIAVVGTRYHDENGRRITRQLSAGLAAGGAIVVSGGATGLDSEALEAALDENGICLSFQACGIDVNYPQAVAPLRERLLENGGLLMSEFPLGTPAYRHNFRIRNRLISAAADGTLVTQAPRGSGALITAEWAREQGKDVFAVPGAVGISCCEGSNDLLKDGAQLVTNVADILIGYVERYPFAIRMDRAAQAEHRALQIREATPKELAAAKPIAEGTPAVQQVAQASEAPKDTVYVPCPADADETMRHLYESLADAPKTVTELARACSVSSADVLSALTELELYGVVTCTAGQRYELLAF